MFTKNQKFRKKCIDGLSKLSRILLILIIFRCICLLIADGLGNASLAEAFAVIRDPIKTFFLPPEGATGLKALLMRLLYTFWGLSFYTTLRSFLGIPAILIWIGLHVLIRYLHGKFRVRDVVTTVLDTVERVEEPKHGKDTPLEKFRRSQILIRVISTPSAPLTIDEVCNLRDIVEWNISKTLQEEGLQVQFNNCDFRLCLQDDEPVIYLGSEKIQSLTVDTPVMLRDTENKQPLVYVMRLEG